MEVIKKLEVVAITRPDGGVFYKALVGAETHGRPSFSLWVSPRLIDVGGSRQPTLRLPAPAVVVETGRGTRVVRPSADHLAYLIKCPCGYRGDSTIEVLAPSCAVMYHARWYESPKGNLGVSAGGLVVVPVGEKVVVRWAATGRLYGRPARGISIISPDGVVVDIQDIPDGLDEIQAIRELTE